MQHTDTTQKEKKSIQIEPKNKEKERKKKLNYRKPEKKLCSNLWEEPKLENKVLFCFLSVQYDPKQHLVFGFYTKQTVHQINLSNRKKKKKESSLKKVKD